MEPFKGKRNMRKIEYLSPTCIEKWQKNKDEFYFTYLCEKRPPRLPQLPAMAVGSSFDAHVKSALHNELFGNGFDPKYDLKALFEAQVEPQNRDKAWEAGALCLQMYKQLGAYSDLMLELSKAVSPPRFEIEVKGTVNGYREGVSKHKFGVTFLGKPDLFFINAMGAHVILDWKVNGYYSKASPTKGFVKIRGDLKNPNGCHKDAHLMAHNGIMVNVADYFHSVNPDWGRQLSIYGWLCGEEIGNEFVVGVDQLCWSDGYCRIASHRYINQRPYQWQLFATAQEIWEIVQSDHIFRDRTKEESINRCEMLNEMANNLRGEGEKNDQWFANVTRDPGHYRK